MSSLVINGDTSGSITLAAPAVAGSNTLTLPTLTGTVLTNKTAGTVLQVVSSKSNTLVSAVNNADLLAVSITPSSASSKILVTGFFMSALISSTNAYMTGYLYRGTNSGTIIFNSYGGSSNSGGLAVPWSASVLDSPNTTSSQTYTLVAGKGSGGTTSWTTDNTSYSLTLMEIAA